MSLLTAMGAIILLSVAASMPIVAAEGQGLAFDGELKPFLGEPHFEKQRLFADERFPNVLVTREGTVLATWGKQRVRVRRSEDGGQTWGPEILVGKGIHGGGAIVDQMRGDVFIFTHPEHPPTDGKKAPRTLYRSTDDGKTWKVAEAIFQEDTNRFLPSLHMSEHGVILLREPQAGRLIRPARVYQRSPKRYSTTIFSDDGGQTWQSGEPLPILGTGEAALLELSSGELLYTARRSYFPEGEAFRHERVFLRSDDGGKSWQHPAYSRVLPDGPRYRGEQRRGANYNGHFGMLAGFTRLPVKGRDILLYSNADHEGHERIRLTVWASFDGGKTWPLKRLVHKAPSAYSSLVAGRPGTPSEGWIYLQYEFGESGKPYAGGQMARFNLAWLLAGERTGDGPLPDWLTPPRD